MQYWSVSLYSIHDINSINVPILWMSSLGKRAVERWNFNWKSPDYGCLCKSTVLNMRKWWVSWNVPAKLSGTTFCCVNIRCKGNKWLVAARDTINTSQIFVFFRFLTFLPFLRTDSLQRRYSESVKRNNILYTINTNVTEFQVND